MDLVDQLSTRGFDCVCGNLRMAARAVSSVYDRHLADAGVKSSQMAVLWAVSNAQGMTVKELAERIAMHETTLIRNLRILEREGWVSLAVGSDRRQRIASLTRQGRAVFGKALLGWKKAQSEMAGVLEEKIPDANRKLVRLARAVWQA
jgi:DNA-binding MarR family transcriptional regulator